VLAEVASPIILRRVYLHSVSTPWNLINVYLFSCKRFLSTFLTFSFYIFRRRCYTSMVFLLLWTGVQRHLDAGEVDRGAEESDQRQGKSDEGGTDQTSHPPVQTQRRSLSRPASVWVREPTVC